MSRTLRAEDFALLTSRDHVNWVRRKYKRASDKWLVDTRPFPLDTLKMQYDALSISFKGYEFHPDSFKVCQIDRALREIVLNEDDPSRLDTNYYCFERYDANDKVDDTLASYIVDSLGKDMPRVIRRISAVSSSTTKTKLAGPRLMTASLCTVKTSRGAPAGT